MKSSSSQSFQNPENSRKASENLLNEYDAVRFKAGLFNLNAFAKIGIKGKDRVKFLQGLTTNDIARLSEGNGLYSILPTVKGKVASEAHVYAFSDHLLLILHPGLREVTLQILNKFRIGTDAQMEDWTEKYDLLSIQGPKSGQILSEFFQRSLPSLLPFQFLTIVYEGATLQIIRDDWSEEEGFNLLIPASLGEKTYSKLLEKGKFFGLIPAGEETFETVRIEAGLPRYGTELSEEIFPQEAGLEKKAISYSKGCYIGQETIARLHYLGHTNRSLVGLFPDHDFPEKNDTIQSGDKNIGLVTSSVFSPSLKRVICLGYLHRQYLQAGTIVEINHRGGRIRAEVAELPFYRPEQKKKES